MKLFKSLKRFFGGVTTEVDNNIKNTKTYWVGVQEKQKEELDKINNSHVNALAEYNVANKKYQELEMGRNRKLELLKKSKENSDFQADPTKKKIAFDLFQEIKQLEIQLSVQKKFVDMLQKNERLIFGAVEKASARYNENSLKICENISKIEFTNLTKGEVFNTSLELLEVSDIDAIDLEYEKANIKIEKVQEDPEVAIRRALNTSDNEFDDFMKNL